MRLCLISPPHSYLVHPQAQASLGLMYVAAAAENAGHDVTILDLAGHDRAMEFPLADVFGLTATSLDYALDGTRIAATIRAQHPEAKIILGGAVSLDPGQVDFRLFDTLVVGDGEKAICDLLIIAEQGCDLPPVYHGAPTDIESAAPPARHLWPGALGGVIFASGETHYPGGSTTLTTARGCPHKCAFCANPTISNRRVRLRPVGDVIAEMERVVTDHGIREFRISDETINMKRSRIDEFCKTIRDSAILSSGIAWKGSSRAKPNDVEMYRGMAAAGCKELSVGIESADPRVLEVLDKDATPKDGVEALHNIQHAGIVARALFMAGTPGERPETLRYNLRFFLDADYDMLSLSVFVPFPGCDIWKDPAKYRCDIVNDDVATYNLYYYDSHGARDVKPYVRLWDYDYDEMANNMVLMRRVAQGLGGLNRG